MALPLIPLAVRAGLALAKNKKAREALTKSVGGFLGRRQKLATTAKELKDEGLKTAKVDISPIPGAGKFKGDTAAFLKRRKNLKK
tara:strand:+ start:76 stop:330 length:255 start_codon:yes stop_codon:yes gene_type:complete